MISLKDDEEERSYELLENAGSLKTLLKLIDELKVKTSEKIRFLSYILEIAKSEVSSIGKDN